MIVADASVLIAHLDGRDAHHDAAIGLLLDHAHLPLGASTISVAETLVAPARSGRLAEAQDALSRLGLRELTLGPGAAQRLAHLRADTALRMPDCCVLLAAREVPGALVATFDERLRAAAAAAGLAIA